MKYDWELIKCPNCFKDNELEKLEANTEYQCWSGEDTTATCLYCDEDFTVKCEHAGYNPKNEFDSESWCRKNIKVKPDKMHWHIIHSVVSSLADGCDPMEYCTDKETEYYVEKKATVDFVTPILNEFKKQLAGDATGPQPVAQEDK